METSHKTKMNSSFQALHLPDTMDVLDGIADLFPQFLLIKLHLKHITHNSICPQPQQHLFSTEECNKHTSKLGNIQMHRPVHLFTTPTTWTPHRQKQRRQSCRVHWMDTMDANDHQLRKAQLCTNSQNKEKVHRLAQLFQCLSQRWTHHTAPGEHEKQ